MGGRPTRRVLGVIVASVGLAVPAAVALSSTSSVPSPSTRLTEAKKRTGPMVGQAVPDVSWRGFGGMSVSVRDLRGHPVVLGLFSSWCPACEGELRDLDTVAAERPVTALVVAVAIEDSPGAAAEFVNRLGAKHLSAGIDTSGAAGRSLLVLGPPDTFLIGPDSTVVEDWRGPVGADQVTAALREDFPAG